jgi:hypothetical protein
MLPADLFHTDFLLSSLIWGSIGVGCVIYGKKQTEAVPLIGGLALVAVSYLLSSALWMSLVSILLIGGMVAAKKQGF